MHAQTPVTALLDDRYTVPSPSGSAAWREIQRSMARWSNGTEHDRRRAIATAALAPLEPSHLRERARLMTIDLRSSSPDLTALARTVPVAVLAETLGFRDPFETARTQRIVSMAIAPEDGAPANADEDVERSMAWLLEASGAETPEEGANRVALLHQCMDATAGLILNSYIHWIDDGEVTVAADPSTALVGWALQHARPVVHTLRSDPRGNVTTVSLANSPFGAGRHECPGRDLAHALASGVLDALCSTGFQSRVQVDGNERRANLHIPKLLDVTGHRRASRKQGPRKGVVSR